MLRFTVQLGVCLSLFAAAPAWAGNSAALTAEPVQGDKVRIDGEFREWPSQRMLELSEGASAPRAAAGLGYDDSYLYVYMKVADRRVIRSSAAKPNEDHATLYIAFPKGRDFATYSVELYPGNPGKVPGAVKMRGTPVAGARLVEAPVEAGLNIEAQIPWAAFPEASRVRVGLHAALAYTNADRPGAKSGTVATSSARSGRALPPLLLEAEQGVASFVLRPNSLPLTPTREAFGNIAGDPVLERVALFGNQLVIVGSRFRNGREFYYGELGIARAEFARRLELSDFDGDGKSEIVLVKRMGSNDRYRDVLTVLKLGSEETPYPIFSHEVSIKTGQGVIENEVKITSNSVEVAQGKAEGFDPETYAEPLASEMRSALLPWQSVFSRTFRMKGGKFEAVAEKTWTPKLKPGKGRGAVTAVASPEPSPEPTPSASVSTTLASDEQMDRLYALYRKERKAAGRPNFDLAADVAADETPERIVIHGRDIVVFGKNFRNGTSYAFIGIGGITDPKDVTEASTRDVTGDGKAEILVRCLMHAKASKALGGGVVERHAFLVYQLQGDTLTRIFGAETARAVGKNQISSNLAFERERKGTGIVLRPGRAQGWTEKSYPFPVDNAPAGGLEPLLVPWGDVKARHYSFDGTVFVQNER